MNEVVLDGIKYTRYNKKWLDKDYMIVHDSLQKELNTLYLQSLDLKEMAVVDIIREADCFKESTSYGAAITLYTYVMEKANPHTAAYILPRITSCYRKLGRPSEVITVMKKAQDKYGKAIFTPYLLTSAAAAYCDLEEYDKALRLCNMANAANNGTYSSELSLVYKRIKANTK